MRSGPEHRRPGRRMHAPRRCAHLAALPQSLAWRHFAVRNGKPCASRPDSACSRGLPEYIARLPRGVSPPLRACGEVAEWSIAHAWKACLRETVTRVRIPLSPPNSRQQTLTIAAVENVTVQRVPLCVPLRALDSGKQLRRTRYLESERLMGAGMGTLPVYQVTRSLIVIAWTSAAWVFREERERIVRIGQLAGRGHVGSAMRKLAPADPWALSGPLREPPKA